MESPAGTRLFDHFADLRRNLDWEGKHSIKVSLKLGRFIPERMKLILRKSEVSLQIPISHSIIIPGKNSADRKNRGEI
jgi:hypothetical protein